MSSVKLYYFDIRGRAELVRLVLALAGQDYEDVRFGRDDWPKYKADAPFGQAPYADIGGQTYGQSGALACYFARENGLYGQTNLETLRIDEVMGLAQDLRQKVIQAVRLEQNEAKKAELNEKLVTEDFPKFFGFFQGLLEKNGSSGVFVGKDLTLADLCVYDIMFNVSKTKNYDATANFSELKTLQDKVETNTNVKAYLAQRKDTPF